MYLFFLRKKKKSNHVIGTDTPEAHKLVAIPSSTGNGGILAADQGVQGQAMAVELDASGAVVSEIYANYWYDSSFRTTPFETIHGEMKI